MASALGLVLADVALLVGLGQLCLLFWGIREMRNSNESRQAGMQMFRDQHQEAMANHQEVMAALRTQHTALETLIQRTSSSGAGRAV